MNPNLNNTNLYVGPRKPSKVQGGHRAARGWLGLPCLRQLQYVITPVWHAIRPTECCAFSLGWGRILGGV
ncbi:uncharacterized protein LACBIDRAFT_315760 [Laccaria bicolor S238N-H82]|uniref:Predicted protein n=1 Tax=Laccaria bicolor (strain S238N-H82 / ATCC MYA-4686) TaxID=486041 RepID=B0D339_LACBS|nr:uncharacterized protein LACBIDRAFT_315760 [Laccaria bicolor S238N-H82]EDR11211.1 predicted protein [Laccaria bicolor S238N-H82]|eukprot:XP_001878512.1 predicted protein [Laccaria bicolor S238N-H82]